jgi:hypothetical protein
MKNLLRLIIDAAKNDDMNRVIELAENKQDKFCDNNCVWTDHHPECVYTTQQRKPLTDEQIRDGYNNCEWTHAPAAHWFEAGVKFSEAAHGIKE